MTGNLKKIGCIILLSILVLMQMNAAPAAAETETSKLIAITFDDGPLSVCRRILDICDTYNIPFTFFVIGQRIEEHPDILLRMVEAGCEIGNHAWSHGYLTELTQEEMIREIEQTNAAVAKVAPEAQIYFVRSPYFSYNDQLLSTVWYPFIDANVHESSAEEQEKTLEALLNVKDGDIVLLHCWNEGSVWALEKAVPQLLKWGFRFVTVTQLFRMRGVVPQNGVIYKSLPDDTLSKYQRVETVFADGELTAGEWDPWPIAAQLNTQAMKNMTSEQFLLVEYESHACPMLTINSWSGGKEYCKVQAFYDNGYQALYSYQEITAAFESDDVSLMDRWTLRPSGEDIIIKQVDLVTAK